MSSPIDIPRRTTRSALTPLSSSSSSPFSSPTSLSPVTTPSSSPGLYIPIHKRTASSESSHAPKHPTVHPRIYTIDSLLSLRPTADESLRDKLRSSVPEIFMSRRIRKGIEFHDRQCVHHDPIPTHDQIQRQHIDLGIHQVPALPPQKQFHVPSVTPVPHQALHGRVLLRRNSKSAIRVHPAERRRQVSKTASAETWRRLTESPQQSLVVS